MKNPSRWVLFIVAGLIGVTLLWQGAKTVYLQPRRALLEKLEKAQTSAVEYKNKLDERPRLQRKLREIGERTLGNDLETVDHLLRTRLNRIAEELRIERATVATGSSTARRSPAYQLFSSRNPVQRELREMIDFVEIDGSITAEGSLPQIVELLDRIEAEPWIKRVNEVRLTPHGPSNGERFGATIRLQTLFIPDPSVAESPLAEDAEALTALDYDESRRTRFASLLVSNPFKVPPPEQPAPEVQPAAIVPPTPPKFPYGQWQVTGVAQTGAAEGGIEVWLRHRKSGEARHLTPGESIGEATFVAIDGDQAIFEMDESRFLVPLGGNLDHRSPVNK